MHTAIEAARPRARRSTAAKSAWEKVLWRAQRSIDDPNDDIATPATYAMLGL
jgi:hypothetical protein